MTQWNIAQRFSDRSNPIVVKEVRQAVKSKAYIGLYLILLFICVVISLFACGSYLRSGVGSAIGNEVFGAFLVCLWITGFVLMPMGAFNSLAKERTEHTFELLNISGLGPGKIVRGKLGAAVVQLGLIYSAFVPFMAFTYFLRGIDLPMMIFFIVSSFLISVFFIMLALTASAIAATKRAFGLMRAGFFFVLIILCFNILGGGISFISFGGGIFGRGGWSELLQAALATAIILGSYFVILYLLAVSRLTFLADNRSTLLKIAFTLQSLLFAGLFLYLVIETGDEEYWIVFGLIMAIQWAIVATFVTTEPEEISRRVAKTVPKRRIWRWLFGYFWPGCSLGWAYMSVNLVLLLVIYFGIPLFIIPLLGGTGLRPMRSLLDWPGGTAFGVWTLPLLIASYVFIYLGLTSIIFRVFASKRRTPYIQRLFVLLLLVLGTVIPFMLEGLLGTFGRFNDPWLYLSSPFAMIVFMQHRSLWPMVTVIVLGSLFLVIHLRIISRGYLVLGRIAKTNRTRLAQANSSASSSKSQANG